MENSPFSKADFIVQPLIGKLRKWGCDASPTFKYWDMFLVAVQIMLSIKNSCIPTIAILERTLW
jgi:hypothetical protein